MSPSAPASSSAKTKPKVIVFDLDGCLWRPEMYQLWGGAPFKELDGGRELEDRKGERVFLLGDVRAILYELKTSDEWREVTCAVASTCNEPEWGHECIRKFDIGGGYKIKDVFQHLEIYSGCKSNHLKTIARKTGAKPDEMVFFDDRMYNLQAASKLGLTSMLTPHGVTREAFNAALEAFPAPGKVLRAGK